MSRIFWFAFKSRLAFSLALFTKNAKKITIINTITPRIVISAITSAGVAAFLFFIIVFKFIYGLGVNNSIVSIPGLALASDIITMTLNDFVLDITEPFPINFDSESGFHLSYHSL